ncbi:Amidase [Ostertagia ostertagi]
MTVLLVWLSFLEQPKLDECTMVTHLRNLGAVPFVITNVPQALLSFVCSNSVYGTTSNPHDVPGHLEVPLVEKVHCLPVVVLHFAIGSDLAGSLRIPAAFCGFVTLKPSQERLVVKHTHGGVPGRGRLGLSFGFFTHTVEEQVELLRLIVGDPKYIRLVPTSILVPMNKRFRIVMRSVASFILDSISPQLAALSSAYVSNLEDLRYTQELCDAYKDQFIDYWKSLGIDALICPTFPGRLPLAFLPSAYLFNCLFQVPAVPHRFPSRLSAAATYTGLYNLLDFPAGAVPAGKVTSEDDQDLLDESKFPVGYNVALRYVREASMNSVGLPLSVQVVTLPYEEEKCLRVMGEVERVWKNLSGSNSFVSVSQ